MRNLIHKGCIILPKVVGVDPAGEEEEGKVFLWRKVDNTVLLRWHPTPSGIDVVRAVDAPLGADLGAGARCRCAIGCSASSPSGPRLICMDATLKEIKP